jgi:mono/diheme cytochrome c family protein
MGGMRVAPALVVLLVASGAGAQPAGDDLNDTQKLGRSMFVQSCGVCHLKPQLTAPQFAPVLSQDSLGGREDAMAEVIATGTPRMPGFKYQFDKSQIAAIAAYLKTVPKPAADTPAPAAKRESRDAD